MKLTSFNITSTLKYMEVELIKETGLSHTAFHRKAIDTFLQGDQKIDYRLKMKKRSHPDYVKKPIAEPIYLDEEREHELLQVAQREKCGITVVLFQALYDYCIMCSTLLSDDVIAKIIEK